MSRESAYYDDQSKGGGGMGRKLAEIAAIGAGGAGLMAAPIKLASMTGQKMLDAKKREADAEMKRESRGIEKPANFDAIEEAKQDAKDAAARKKISDMGYKKGGKVSSASKRADGIATKGKTRGTIIAMCGGGMYKGK
jgi:hypothetical protein